MVSDLDDSGLSTDDGAGLGLGDVKADPAEVEGRLADWSATGDALVQPASRIDAARAPVHLMFR